MKILKAFLLAIIFAALMVAVGVWWLTQYSYSPVGFTGSKVFIVEKGRGISQISRELSQQGVIRYPQVFSGLAKFEGKTNPKFGEYAFTSDMSPSDMLSRMENGETILRKVIVPEGRSVYEIYEMLKKSERLKLTATEMPVEGSLLPSTYYYTYGDTDLDVIAHMQRGQKEVIEELWPKRAENLPFQTEQEALILASIVEKETGVDGERGLVASVFMNRLNKGMKLESDPTAVYGITKGVPLGRKPTGSDVGHMNEYNTYKIPALPPTPICNPGKAAIEAVLNPPSSEFLFFVANGKGGHNFSKTYAEHVKNIQIYREVLRSYAAPEVVPTEPVVIEEAPAN